MRGLRTAVGKPQRNYGIGNHSRLQKRKCAMSQPRLLSDILLDIAADPNEPMGAILRQCPFIQAELIRRKKMSLDDLTDEQIDRLIDWDQKEGGKDR